VTESELGRILRDMYDNAPEGEQVLNIYLFGIKYGFMIYDNNFKPIDIIRCSGLAESYATEVGKAIKLSNYVTLK
jgi:5-methylcytosine-specific restriction protein B